MDVQPEPLARAAPPGSAARRRRRRPCRRRARARPSSRSGWSTGMPSRSAVDLRRRRGDACGRGPRGRSGRVRSAATSCRGGEPLEHVGAERRRRRDGDPHGASRDAEDRLRPERRERLAARLRRPCGRGSARRRGGRARAGRRAPSCSSSSSRSSLAVEVARLERDVDRPLDRDEHALRARGSPRRRSRVSPERSTIRGLTTRGRSSSSSAWKTKTRWRTPTCVAASPTPRASCIRRSSARRAARGRRRSRSTSFARIRSTGSGYWRICASATRRRASTSASSCSSRRCRLFAPPSSADCRASSRHRGAVVQSLRATADRRRRPP